MALYERICGRNDLGQSDENLQKIAIDTFSALMIEYTFAADTNAFRALIINEIGLSGGELTDLDTILALGANAAARRDLYTRVRPMFHLAEANVSGYGLPSELQAIVEAL